MTPGKMVAAFIVGVLTIVVAAFIVIGILSEHNRSTQENSDLDNAFCQSFPTAESCQ